MKLNLRVLSTILSGILSVISIWAVATYGLRVGIDFQGGELLELRFAEPATIDEIRTSLEAGEQEQGLPNVSVAQTAENTFLLRTATQSSERLDELRTYLTSSVGDWREIRFEQVGPTVGKDLTRKAVIGVLLASVAIILYIAWAFRRVPPPTNSWQFGVSAIVALLHDLLITVGGFAILGQWFGYEVDSLFITALLTVMGFSVHDTIVTYDRLRENLLHHPGVSFERLVDVSINQTVIRSLNTSFTLLFVLLSLALIGGSSIRPFIVALLIGVSVGTYSSIFVATQLLVVWQRAKSKATSK